MQPSEYWSIGSLQFLVIVSPKLRFNRQGKGKNLLASLTGWLGWSESLSLFWGLMKCRPSGATFLFLSVCCWPSEVLAPPHRLISDNVPSRTERPPPATQGINLNNVASLRWRSPPDDPNQTQPPQLPHKTFNFQLLLGAQFCSEGSMQNGWKIANVIYIKVRLEETNYASDSAQLLSSCPSGNNSIILGY